VPLKGLPVIFSCVTCPALPPSRVHGPGLQTHLCPSSRRKLRTPFATRVECPAGPLETMLDVLATVPHHRRLLPERDLGHLHHLGYALNFEVADVPDALIVRAWRQHVVVRGMGSACNVADVLCCPSAPCGWCCACRRPTVLRILRFCGLVPRPASSTRTRSISTWTPPHVGTASLNTLRVAVVVSLSHAWLVHVLVRCRCCSGSHECVG